MGSLQVRQRECLNFALSPYLLRLAREQHFSLQYFCNRPPFVRRMNGASQCSHRPLRPGPLIWRCSDLLAMFRQLWQQNRWRCGAFFGANNSEHHSQIRVGIVSAPALSWFEIPVHMVIDASPPCGRLIFRGRGRGFSFAPFDEAVCPISLDVVASITKLFIDIVDMSCDCAFIAPDDICKVAALNPILAGPTDEVEDVSLLRGKRYAEPMLGERLPAIMAASFASHSRLSPISDLIKAVSLVSKLVSKRTISRIAGFKRGGNLELLRCDSPKCLGCPF